MMNKTLNGHGASILRLASLTGLAFLAIASDGASAPTAPSKPPVFALPPMPYPKDALEPYLSSRAVNFHYAKHHQAYVDNLNKLLAEMPWTGGQTLESIVLESAEMADKASIFNNAAQAWNHTFFWRSMKKDGGGLPSAKMMSLIAKSFGSFDEFKSSFMTAAAAQFGSGWVWLVQEGGSLKIVKTSNADTPITRGQTPLLACDVWEHAYYLDYQNRRKDFVQAFLEHLANWDFAELQLR